MISPFLHFVTVTGADDSVKVSDLLALEKKYPFVEFGILLSKSQIGMPRFPSHAWLDKLTSYGSRLKLSGHLCGQYVREFLEGKLHFEKAFDPGTAGIFSRWQINTHGIPANWNQAGLDKSIEGRLAAGQKIIFQWDGVNILLYSHVLKRVAAAKPDEPVSFLFDLSHGAGVLPDSWPALKIDAPVGYAGGLSPDNVAQELEKIAAVAEAGTWIDAETHLRSNDDRQFDLDQVDRFLAAAAPYVRSE
jgi:hypothetical protein